MANEIRTHVRKLRLIAGLAMLCGANALSAVGLSDAAKMGAENFNRGAMEISGGVSGGKRLVVLGNSITLAARHVEIGWMQDCGCAASAPEKDFVHVLVDGLNRRHPEGVEYKVKNVWLFERNWKEFDLGKYDHLVAFKPDILVVAIGENMAGFKGDDKDFEAKLSDLVGRFRLASPQCRIVIRGVFWANPAKDAALKAVADRFGADWVSISDLGKRDDCKAVGLFESRGIANHPGDLGMSIIAERILAALDGKTSAQAKWIGESGIAETAWRDGDARRNRGITGAQGHDFILSNRLTKTTCRLRKKFVLRDKPIVKATAVASGMGFYELWLNGAKVDPRRVLAPGMSKSRTLADAYDVTKMLKPGTENAVGFWLAPGYSDDFSRFGWLWLAPKRAILTLTVAYADGSEERIVTDGSWESTDATPILSASIYHGEVCDAGREDALWATPRGAKTGWKPVTVFPDGPATTVNTAPPVRLCERFRPVSVVESEPGVYTVDFGQNLAGVVRIRAHGARGTKITVATAELLDEKGRITQWTNNGARATDTFILAGTGEVEEFTPRFTYHGFQFAEVRGYPGKLTADDLESVAVHADVRRTSSFRCSDETLNWLHRAATWSMLSNLMSYPTDCCMRRERTPCRMDSICYEDVACTLFDMRDYYPKWLADNVSAFGGGSPDNDGEPTFLATRLWHHYGTRVFADRHYDDMLRYLRGLEAKWPTGIIDKTYGDWCAPNAGTWETYFNDIEVVNVSLYAKLLGDVAEVARARGREDDAERLRRRLENVKTALNSKLYSSVRGEYGDGSQTTAVLPLAFGLVPDGERAKVVSSLLRRIRGKDKGKIDTGIFGTRYIGEVLCDLGESDLLMELYAKKDYPGFGHMREKGATTLWEQWRYKGGMHSHNHAMNAGGISWLYTRLAGIRYVRPGGAEILVKPCFPSRLSFVEATRETPHGTVGVTWRRKGDALEIRVAVPKGVSAKLDLPDAVRTLAAGENVFTVPAPLGPHVPFASDLGAAAAHPAPKGAGTVDVAAPRAHGGAVLRASDFGFSPSNDDNGAAIAAVLAEAKRRGAAKVCLAPGVYRCFGDPIEMEGFADFELDGCGAELVFRRAPSYPIEPSWGYDGSGANFAVRNCRRVRIGNLVMDWDWRTMPLATCAKVVATHLDEKTDNASYVDFDLLGHGDRHPYYGKTFPIQRTQPMTADSSRFLPGLNMWHGTYEGEMGCKCEWLSPTRVRAYPFVESPGSVRWLGPNKREFSPKLNRGNVRLHKVGETYRIAHAYYGKGGFTLISNEDLDLHDIEIPACFGHAFFIGGSQRNWRLKNVTVAPRDLRHPISSSADAVHFVRSHGNAIIDNLVVRLNQDDAINVHDRFTVVRRAGPRTLRIALERGSLYFSPGVGHDLELLDSGYNPTGWKGKCVKSAGEDVEVDLDLPDANSPEGHWLLFDRTASSDGLIIRNCTFEDMEMRTLINVSNATVEDCVFRRTNGDALRCIADYTLKWWAEGMGTTNVVVRNCRFESNCVREMVGSYYSLGADFVTWLGCPEGLGPGRLNRKFISDILVENCTFVDSLGYFADLRFGSDIVFRGNSIVRTGERANDLETAGSARLEWVDGVLFEGNVFKVPNADRCPRLDIGNGVKGVVLRANKVVPLSEK